MNREDEEEIAAIVAAVRQIPRLGGDDSIVQRIGERVAKNPPLSPHARRWLEDKTADELKEVDRLLALLPKIEQLATDYEAARTIGKAGKWLLIAIGAVGSASYAAVKMGLDIAGAVKGVGK